MYESLRDARPCKTNWLFVCIGGDPRTEWAIEAGLVRDVRHGSVKRCASPVGEGAMSVMFVHRYLAEG